MVLANEVEHQLEQMGDFNRLGVIEHDILGHVGRVLLNEIGNNR